ncbi:MAG: orotidine-5'-phosphate decarboxylase [Pirellulaceae bacterium]
MVFADRLAQAVQRVGNPVMVGLDPRWENLPDSLRRDGDSPAEKAQAFQIFSCEVIDAVKDLVGIVKPQMAFFEQLGPSGFAALAEVTAYARRQGLLVVLDGKRNDIGSTGAAYADAYLGEQASGIPADALTVSPYLGDDSLTPFIEVADQRDAGVFVLVKTSNPGGKLLQDLVSDSLTIYQRMADLVNAASAVRIGECGYGSVGAVVGATYPQQLAELRQRMPQSWLLVPGFGAQGGTADSVAAAFDAKGLGAVVNNSRGIIFAYQRSEYAHFAGSKWQNAVEAATKQMIEQLRTETSVSQL